MKYQGWLAIGGLIVMYWVLDAFWPLTDQAGSVHSAALVGGTAYLLMATAMVMAARPRFLEDAFGGLDRMYQVHKICGISTALLVVTHFVLAPKGLAPSPSGPLGLAAMVILLVSIAAAMSPALPYNRWKPAHKLMGLVFVLVTLHLLTSPYIDHLAAPALLLYAAMLAGFAGLIGSQRKRADHRYTLTRSDSLERATELTLAPIGEPMRFRPGQFAFIEFDSPDLAEAHPFSIASSPHSAELRFAIRAAGDWTTRLSTAADRATGTGVTVRGPYGRFAPGSGEAEQVWIAGGIGITPFLSALREQSAQLPPTTLFYAVRSHKEALFLDEIQNAAERFDGALQVIVLASDQDERIDVDTLTKNLPKPLPSYDYYLCGPGELLAAVRTTLRRHRVPARHVHFERFKLR
jgi:predicted ferric reductase